MKISKKKTGGFLDLFIIARRNLYRNKRRTVLCVLAVAVAVFFNIFMQSWIQGMYDGIEEVVRTFETGHVVAVTDRFEAEKEYYPVQFPLADGKSAEELSAAIEALPGVRAALPRITAYASLFDSTVKHALLWGIDAEREHGVNRFNLTRRDDGTVEGRYPRNGANECMVGSAFAEKTGVRIGDRLPFKTVSAQFSDKFWNPRVVGIFEFDYRKYDEDVIIVPFDRLGNILVLNGSTQQIYVYADDARRSPAVRESVSAILGPGHTVREWTDNYWVAVLKKSAFLYYIVFAVFQIVASFLIINTVIMVIQERIKEIGMMGALGMTRGEIVRVFFFEALLLSVLGALAGCLLGGLAGWFGSRFPMDLEIFTGGGLKEMPVSGSIFIAFSPAIIGRGFLFGVFVSAVCTLIPSMKSAFIEPVEALRR